MSQNKIFINGEANAWFNRNRNHIRSINEAIKLPDVCYLLNSLTMFSGKIKKILEIGCSNGFKLEAICQQIGAEGVGVEPSQDAVHAGNNRKKDARINLLVGTGENLPCEDESFELVYFAFCLYLFDRNMLMKSLSEADRVLKPGGFLVITDFDPGFRHKKPYSHYSGLFSYKQDYSSFFTQSGLYYLMGKQSFSHHSSGFDELPDERISTNILYKEVDPYPMRS